MKKTSLVLFLSAFGNANAELPPVIDHSSYPPSATPSNAPSSNTLYELMARLDQLQAEIQQLTGKVDEQAYLIEELKKHQKTMYSDFDERLQTMENKANGTDQATTETPSDAESSSETGDTSANENEPTPPIETKTAEEQSPVSQEAPADKTENVEASTPKPAAIQVSGTEKQEYQQAYNELRNGHTNESIEQFKAYLEKYPTGGYANNAQYWLGEAYRVNQDNEAARKAFNDVIEKYPDGAKVPDALLKLGYIEIDQNNMTKAREYLTRVTTDYPKSPAALLASKKLLKLEAVKN